MNKQHNFKIATDSPTDIAKQILRCESFGTLTCSGNDISGVTVAVASDLSGAPLIFMPFDSEIEKLLKHEKNTTLQLGGTPSLSISFRSEAPDHNVLNFLETRFYSRHHEPEEEGLIVRLHPVHASLAEDSKVIEIAGDDLLAQSSEELLELERRAVDHMNDDHLDAIKLYAEVLLGEATGSWRLASLDMEGLDLVSGGYFTRLWFNPPLQEPSDIKKRLVELAILARD